MKKIGHLLVCVCLMGLTHSALSNVVAAWDFGDTAAASGGWTSFNVGASASSTVNGLTLTQAATGGFVDRTMNPGTVQTNAPVLLGVGVNEMDDGFDLGAPGTQRFTLSGLTNSQGYRLQFIGVVRYTEPAQNRNLTITLDDADMSTANLLDYTTLPTGDNAGYSEYVEFIADASGDVVITFGEISSGIKCVSGLIVETMDIEPPDTSLPGYGSHPFSLVGTEVDPVSGNVSLSWEAALNQRFVIERSTDLMAWGMISSNYPSLGADSNMVFYTDTTASPSQNFYRVQRPYDPNKKLNVLMIVVDDLRDHESYSLNNIVQMPNLDRLAAMGVKFSNAFCQATYCNPSRASFLTGLRPDTTQVLNNTIFFRDSADPVVADAITLPQCFRSNGYYTASLGKILHGTQMDPLSWDLQNNNYAQPGQPPKSEHINMTDGLLDWCRWAAPDCEDNELSDGAMAEHAVEILYQKRTDPFFLAVGFKKPHDPFIAPTNYFNMYPLTNLVLHADPLDASPLPPQALSTGGTAYTAFSAMNDQDRLQFLRSYAACSTYVDAQIGKVFSAMDELGLWQNTIVMLWTDHGYHQGERGWWNKTLLDTYDAKVPFIAYVPEMTDSGVACTGVIELVDVYPTLTELAGIIPPENLEGESFSALLNNPATNWNGVAITQRTGSDTLTGTSVFDGRYRYTEWTDGEKQLFDHAADSGEWYNLADDPAFTNLMQSLAQRLSE